MRRIIKHTVIAASMVALSACGLNGTDGNSGDETTAKPSAAPASDNLADSMASNDYGDRTAEMPDIADSEQRPIMQAQVVLDRLGFGPGVVDGKMGMSTENALVGFQKANDLEQTGELDEATKTALNKGKSFAATRIVRIPADWGAKDYRQIPDDAAEQAKMDKLGYKSLDERLAERFHTTIDTLKLLNPDGKPAGMTQDKSTGGKTPPAPTPTATESADGSSESSFFAGGQMIRVPNIGSDRIEPGSVDNSEWQSTLAALGIGSDQQEADRIEVSKSSGVLTAYDADDQIVAVFTVTSGSSHDPLPIGTWKVNGVAYNPPFAYNPDLFWDVPDDAEKQQLPPGPNGPVGVVWIDLSKEHYGIHGTPEPQTIGRAQSHGCVRLTNWDAARLAQMVSPGTQVVFKN